VSCLDRAWQELPATWLPANCILVGHQGNKYLTPDPHPATSISPSSSSQALRKSKVNTQTLLCVTQFLFVVPRARNRISMKSIFFAFQTIIHIYYYQCVRVPLCAENKTAAAAAARPRAPFYVFG
jgi:hypothetical protein